uniref:Uncharacterized protein n=1 Tax=Globodera pallida TaxID=36090 RepID=A0A183BLT0_GLOPA
MVDKLIKFRRVVRPSPTDCRRLWRRICPPSRQINKNANGNGIADFRRIGTSPAKEKSPQPEKMRQQFPAKSEWKRHNNGPITVAFAGSQATGHVPTTVPCTVVEMFDAANTGPLSPRQEANSPEKMTSSFLISPACCRLQDTPIKQNGTGIGMARQQSGTHCQSKGKDMTPTNNKQNQINEIAPREDGSIASSCSNTSNASSSSTLESLMEENGRVWPGKRQTQNDCTPLEELIEQFFHHCQSISTVDSLQQRPLYDNLQPAPIDGTATTEDSEFWLHAKTKVLTQRQRQAMNGRQFRDKSKQSDDNNELCNRTDCLNEFNFRRSAPPH